MTVVCKCGGRYRRTDIRPLPVGHPRNSTDRVLYEDIDPTQANWKCDGCGKVRVQRKRQPVVPELLEWPRCKCGHIAQDHNRRIGDTDQYGCDFVKTCNCMCYRFPATFPAEKIAALEEQRERILQKYVSPENK